MANYRIRPNGIIQYDLHVFGVRFRESSKMPATPKNIKIAKATVKQMNAELELNTFEYRDFFPDSKKVDKFETLRREKYPDLLYPYFDDYTNEWLERQEHRWSRSYYRSISSDIQRYLLPFFGNTLINEITLKQVDKFRESLSKKTNKNGNSLLLNARINALIGPMISIISLASEELSFEYPFRRYKRLRETAAESSPLTKAQLKLFMENVDPNWYDYYLVRFYTGMRSCEIHGLQVKHLIFEHKLIKIRQNWVQGQFSDVKTPKSRRDIKMSEPVYQALKRVIASKNHQDDIVFTDPKDRPLSCHYVARKIWYPTLKKAGLDKRRPYETRHTAAVLHMAALENPVYISRMLGHSNTKMLFDIYAPYVVNATGTDGSAFTRLMAGE